MASRRRAREDEKAREATLGKFASSGSAQRAKKLVETASAGETFAASLPPAAPISRKRERRKREKQAAPTPPTMQVQSATEGIFSRGKKAASFKTYPKRVKVKPMQPGFDENQFFDHQKAQKPAPVTPKMPTPILSVSAELHSSISRRRHQIQSLERQESDMRLENAALDVQLELSITTLDEALRNRLSSSPLTYMP